MTTARIALAATLLSGNSLKHFTALLPAIPQIASVPTTAKLVPPASPFTSPTCLRLVLIRHGEGLHNVFCDQFEGTGDPDFDPKMPVDPRLTNTGREQAEQLRSTVAEMESKGVRPRTVIVSPLRRATETAALAFAAEQATAFVCDHRVAELSNGVRSDLMTSAAVLRTDFPAVDYEEYEKTVDLEEEHAQNSGQTLPESKAVLVSRVTSFLNTLKAMHKNGERVVGVASHSQWLQALCIAGLQFENMEDGMQWFGTGEMRCVDVEFLPPSQYTPEVLAPDRKAELTATIEAASEFPLHLPTTLTADERKFVHAYCEAGGGVMSSKSEGAGPARHVVVYDEPVLDGGR